MIMAQDTNFVKDNDTSYSISFAFFFMLPLVCVITCNVYRIVSSLPLTYSTIAYNPNVRSDEALSHHPCVYLICVGYRTARRPKDTASLGQLPKSPSESVVER